MIDKAKLAQASKDKITTNVIKKFDIKLCAVTTPQQLAIVFRPEYMKYALGVVYDSWTKSYLARGQNGTLAVEPDDQIVYLGFGTWKRA